MTHLTADELIDAMEGVLEAPSQAHLDSCEQCRRELAGLSSVLGEARAVDLPEPAPHFWQHFSRRVRTAIDAEALPSSGWPAWLRWPVLVPLGAVAVLMIAIGLRTPVPVEQPSSQVSANDAAVGATADDLAGRRPNG